MDHTRCISTGIARMHIWLYPRAWPIFRTFSSSLLLHRFPSPHLFSLRCLVAESLKQGASGTWIYNWYFTGDVSLYEKAAPLLDIMGKVRLSSCIYLYMQCIILYLSPILHLLISSTVEILPRGGWKWCCYETSCQHDHGKVLTYPSQSFTKIGYKALQLGLFCFAEKISFHYCFSTSAVWWLLFLKGLFSVRK